MTPVGQEAFLSSGDLVIEEKVDGANLGLSFNSNGHLRAQNRGNFLEGRLSGQWEGLRGWLAEHEVSLKKQLPTEAVLYGEWCYARHSTAYTRLPDWFLGFDVLDAKNDLFWSTRRRDALLAATGLHAIHSVARGRFTQQELKAMLAEPSAYCDAPLEGLYLRLEDDRWLLQRAKLVRPEFVQVIGEHWSRGSMHTNTVIPWKESTVVQQSESKV